MNLEGIGDLELHHTPGSSTWAGERFRGQVPGTDAHCQGVIGGQAPSKNFPMTLIPLFETRGCWPRRCGPQINFPPYVSSPPSLGPVGGPVLGSVAPWGQGQGDVGARAGAGCWGDQDWG